MPARRRHLPPRRHAQEAIKVLVFLGVDSHKDSLAACLVDQPGAQLAAATFPNTPDGHGDLLAWVGRSGQLTRAGVEGAANLGAGLARLLRDQGLDVREVPCALTVRERRRLRRPGKSDPTDALAIARITAREHDLPPARHAGQAEDLKVLSDDRDELVAQRTAEANRLHADLAIVCPGYARHCRAAARPTRCTPRPSSSSRPGPAPCAPSSRSAGSCGCSNSTSSSPRP
jgi:transposase